MLEPTGPHMAYSIYNKESCLRKIICCGKKLFGVGKRYFEWENLCVMGKSYTMWEKYS